MICLMAASISSISEVQFLNEFNGVFQFQEILLGIFEPIELLAASRNMTAVSFPYLPFELWESRFDKPSKMCKCNSVMQLEIQISKA